MRRLHARGTTTTAGREMHSFRASCQMGFFQISFPVFYSLAHRYVSPIDSEYYEGTGYSRVVINRKMSNLIIKMVLCTRSENGLLFYIGNEVNRFPVVLSYGMRNSPVWRHMSESEFEEYIMLTTGPTLHCHHGKGENCPSWQFARCSSCRKNRHIPGKWLLSLSISLSVI